MPETRVERASSLESQRASQGLMLHIANGEFGTSPTTQLDKAPSGISKHSFDALDAQHRKAQEDQQELYDAVHRKTLEGLGWPQEKITPEILRHMHMRQWAIKESGRIQGIFRDITNRFQGDEEQKQEAHIQVVSALSKLHIIIDNGTDLENFADQLYKTTSNTTGVESKFYKEFCSGDSNAKLLNALTEADMEAIKPFLVDMLGSTDAYNALLATKQTHDALGQSVGKEDTVVRLDEYPIMDFFRNGEKLLNARGSVSKKEPQPEGPVHKAGGTTETNPEHPHRNDDTFFIDEEHLRGGIFDGAGGHAGSDKASRAAQDAIREVMDRFPLKGDFPENPIKEQLIEAFTLANERVKALGSGMSTGAVFQIVRSREDGKSSKLLVANIGDSRVWIRRKDGTVTQVSRDGGGLRNMHLKELQGIPHEIQRARNEEIEEYQRLQSRLDSAENLSDIEGEPILKALWQHRNQTSLLGADDSKDYVEFFESPLQEGDTIFMTTDGVHDNLTSQQIAEIAKNAPDPKALSEQLVAKAKEVSGNGTFRSKHDDITAAALRA